MTTEFIDSIKRLLSACEDVADDHSIAIDMMEFEDEAAESREMNQEMRQRMDEVKKAIYA